MRGKTKWRAVWSALLAAIVPIGSAANAREIIDMMGRHVIVADKITRVFSAAPPTTLVVYAMKPEALVGWNFAPSNLSVEDQTKFLSPETRKLPILGNLMGHGQAANVEQILKAKPDVVIVWENGFIDNSNVEKIFNDNHIPVVVLKLFDLSDYPAAFVLMGELFGDEERGKALATYINDALKRVHAAVDFIPDAKRASVYYAESLDGLATDCDRSFHAEAIRQAGGGNVYHCAQNDIMGLEKVSVEQVMLFAPNFIVAQESKFAQNVVGDPRWRNVKAVTDKAIHVVPNIPFNWIDRPPSYMEALGMQWLAHLFYPQAFPIDIRDETKRFYKLFLMVDLSDADVDHLLQ